MTPDPENMVKGIRTKDESQTHPNRIFPRPGVSIVMRALPDNATNGAQNKESRPLSEEKRRQLQEQKSTKQNNGNTIPNAMMDGHDNKQTAIGTEKAFSDLLLQLRQRH